MTSKRKTSKPKQVPESCPDELIAKIDAVVAEARANIERRATADTLPEINWGRS